MKTQKELDDIKLLAKFIEINVTEFTWKNENHLVMCEEDGTFDIDNITFFKLDWNILISVSQKFDNLSTNMLFNKDQIEDYLRLCDRNDDVIKLYDYNSFLKSLIISVNWYNNNNIMKNVKIIF